MLTNLLTRPSASGETGQYSAYMKTEILLLRHTTVDPQRRGEKALERLRA